MPAEEQNPLRFLRVAEGSHDVRWEQLAAGAGPNRAGVDPRPRPRPRPRPTCPTRLHPQDQDRPEAREVHRH